MTPRLEIAEPQQEKMRTSAIMKAQTFESISHLSAWLEKHDYRGYDTFDGLNARLLRPFTFETKFLRTVLQQGVRRFPLNVRPLVGIRKSRSTKGMGFLARGFLRLHRATGDPVWRERATSALEWLTENQSKGYSGAAWGNHFDYQSRGFYLPRGVPTIVWTSLIGHAFIDAYEHLGNPSYLGVARSACEHILQDFNRYPDGDGSCIAYVPGMDSKVHNANTLGASLLARTASHIGNREYVEVAEQALAYTAQYQRSDGSWYYGEESKFHWVDNFHTAYVLDCFQHYAISNKSSRFDAVMEKGYRYWRQTFFLPDGTPRYYNHKTLPVDIQCCSQAIDTLVFFRGRDPESIELAGRVAAWTIRNMQDKTGYFYYRRYSPGLVNKTPTLHWGQATMLCALANLHEYL